MSELKITDEVLLKELKARFEEKENAINNLQALTDELQEVNDKLKASEALKSHFIANINNEIINPFASVLGLSKSILEVKEDNWEKVRRLAQLIFAESFQLDFQLKNIFAAAEIEAGHVFPQLSNVDVKHVIQGVVDDFKNDLASKKLHVELTTDFGIPENETFYFKTDSEKLKLIMSNLVSNSIKFSKGTKIEIHIAYKDKKLIVSVRDYGIGISEHNQKIIFDRFTRLDSGINSVNRGHGLGLSIVKAFLELFNGSITIDSKKGEGALFTITINEPDNSENVQDFSFEGNEVFFGEDEIF
jgi:signal transduction histidine kinase